MFSVLFFHPKLSDGIVSDDRIVIVLETVFGHLYSSISSLEIAELLQLMKNKNECIMLTDLSSDFTTTAVARSASVPLASVVCVMFKLTITFSAVAVTI